MYYFGFLVKGLEESLGVERIVYRFVIIGIFWNFNIFILINLFCIRYYVRR